MDTEKLEDLKHFVELCKENPSILQNPSLTFFKTFLERYSLFFFHNPFRFSLIEPIN